MKNCVVILLILLVFNCDNSEKYYGKWNLDYITTESNAPIQSTITKDSIKFLFPYFDYKHSYKLNKIDKKLYFNNYQINTNIKNDTLIFGQKTFFTRDVNDSIFETNNSKNKVSINLPKLKKINSKSRISKDINMYLYYGKRNDNDRYSLLLNDKFIKNEDLFYFLNIRNCHGSESTPFFNMILFIDKNSKMNDIEKMILTMSVMQKNKVSFINDIDLNYSDSIGLNYSFQTIVKKIHPKISTNYFNNIIRYEQPQTYYYKYPKLNIAKENCQFIILSNNNLFYNNKPITEKELKKIVSNFIDKKETIVTLYDLKSNFYSFIKLLSLIDNSIIKKRNNTALKIYNKEYDELDIENALKIKEMHPEKLIWNYSIPHFNTILKDSSSFYDLKLKPIDTKKLIN